MVGASPRAFLSTFVGRQSELEHVGDLLARHRLVTLVGVGGLGKTRLAYMALERLEGAVDGRTWTVELADLNDPALLGHKVVESIGVAVAPDRPALESLAAYVDTAPALLYLDNCEHLIDACAALVAPLLARCPGLRVLATSRQPLGLIGEQLYPLPAMAHPDAVALFVDRAASVMPSSPATDEDVAAVGRLCDALEGVPLAIELTAVQIRSFSPATILDRLHDRLGPREPVRGEPERTSSIEACVRWSHDLCSRDEQVLWSRLSVFAGGFSVAAAEQVCAGDDLTLDDLHHALAGLVDKSVVERDPTDPIGRYRMLAIIRQFGLDRLQEAGELDHWRRCHRDHYVDLVERFDRDLMSPRQFEWMRSLRAERSNLSAALDFSVSTTAEAPTAMRMAPVLEHFYASTGGGGEAIHWIQRATAHDAGASRDRANALRVGTFIASIMGQIRTAEQFLDQLTDLVDAVTDDELVRAFHQYADAVLRAFSGDAATGAMIAADGIQLLHRLGEDWLEANLLFLSGLMLGWDDRPEEAAAAYRGCFDIGRPRGEAWLSSYAMWGLGLDALMAGRVDDAVALEREALRAKAEFQDQLGIGLTIEVLAWAAADEGRGREAALLLGAAEAIWDVIGMTVAAMPYVSRRREAGVATTRRLVQEDEYAMLVDRGRGLRQVDAIGIALGEIELPRADQDDLLTRREREIAQLVAEGASNRAIADRLVISVRTVESHVENVMRKLGITSRTRVASALAQRRPGHSQRP